MISSILALGWPVLIGVVAAVIIVFALARLLVSKPKSVQTVLDVLEHADALIMFFMPEKYKEVYQSLIAAAKRVIDGAFTRDEAIATARDVFAKTLKQLNVTLSDEEKAFADQILVFVIGMIVKDKSAGLVAINNVCSIKGFRF